MNPLIPNTDRGAHVVITSDCSRETYPVAAWAATGIPMVAVPGELGLWSPSKFGEYELVRGEVAEDDALPQLARLADAMGELVSTLNGGLVQLIAAIKEN